MSFLRSRLHTVESLANAAVYALNSAVDAGADIATWEPLWHEADRLQRLVCSLEEIEQEMEEIEETGSDDEIDAAHNEIDAMIAERLTALPFDVAIFA